jgi:hypothetical protein
MKCQTLEALQPFLSFLNGFDKKGHNMLALMFDQRFKNMQLVVNYLGCENTFSLVVEYDAFLLLLLLTQCHKIRMPFMVVEEVQV